MLTLLVTLAATTAAFADIAGKALKNGSWKITDDGTLVVSINGKMGDYNGKKSVTSAPWGDYADQITAIVVEEGCTSIGVCAFKGLTKVESVKAPSVETIGKCSFENCGVKGITLCFPKVTYVEGKGFKYSNAGRILLPSAKTVRFEAFGESRYLYMVDLGPDIETIGRMAFYGCPLMWVENSTPNVLLGKEPPSIRTLWEADAGAQWEYAMMWFLESVGYLATLGGWFMTDVALGFSAIQSKESFSINDNSYYYYDPDEYKVDRTKDNHMNPFWPEPKSYGMPTVYVPYEGYYNYTSKLGEYLSTAGGIEAGSIHSGGAIYDKDKNYQGWWGFDVETNELTVYYEPDVEIPFYRKWDEPWWAVAGLVQKLKLSCGNITGNVFNRMTNIKEITLFSSNPGKPYEIGLQAFSNMPKLERVYFKGETNYNIGKWAFGLCENLRYVEFENNHVRKMIVGDYAFYGSSIETLSNSGEWTIDSIGAHAFQNTNLQKLKSKGIQMGGVHSIGESAFEGCKNLYSATITDCHTVGKRAFANSSVKRIDFSFSLDSIGEEAFANSKVCDIYAEGFPPKVGKNAFEGTSNILLHVNSSYAN